MTALPVDPILGLADRLDGTNRDLVTWADRRLGEHFWSKQRDIADSLRSHRYTAVHACHDSSKSHTASRAAAHWLDTHPVGEAFVVSTAPTHSQVRAILWREINRAHRKGHLRGRVNQTEWWIDNELVGYGRKPQDLASPEEAAAAFQGIHARYVLVVIDEAGGIPKWLWDAADTLVTNADSRVLAIGNPDDPQSHFAEVCKPGSGWNVIHIDGLETPNFTDEEIPDELGQLLLSPTWVEERKARWGEGSPLYIAKVRGLFPGSASDGVVPLGWVRRNQAATEDTAPSLPVALGVDVGASVDGDETVIRERRGGVPGRVERLQTDEPEEIVGKVVQMIHETGATDVNVDVIGVGFGITGWLRTQAKEGVHGARVHGINVGESAKNPKRFKNRRSEIWWEVGRELTESDGWALHGLDDDTVAQLTAPKYTLDSSGRIVVEKKAETKARIGRSPDDADALLLAFVVESTPATVGHAAGTTLPKTKPSTPGQRQRYGTGRR